ncbi:MAG: LytTR family DNA-binding domain-containing protein [Pseudomonadota bacterium]
MRILIADDEPLARLRMRALVEEIGGHEIVGEASNGREVLDMNKAHQPHVVLLDIGMPGINGMEAAERLAEMDPRPIVIFTTAYEEYALEAFEKQAIDYLLKPVRKERLGLALDRASALVQETQSETSDEQTRTHIRATTQGRVRLIPVSEIYYFMAEQKYVTLRWAQGEVLLDETLTSLEKEFSGQFLRIHRNALVALSWINGLEKGDGGRNYIVFEEIDTRLEISRRHLPNVKKIIRDIWGKR